MSKSIASYPEAMRRTVIARRLTQNSRGNGYWAARDAAAKLGIPVPSDKKEPKTPRKKLTPSDERRRERRANKQRGGGVKLREFAQL